MKIACAMRTTNRAPKPNYLGGTLRRWQAAGGSIPSLHLCLSRPEMTWLAYELGEGPSPRLHVPLEKRNANANGLACVDAALSDDAEMILLLEDDLAFCADFLGSVSRWLDQWARPDRHVYRLFGFTTPPKGKPAAYDAPLEGLRASQAILLWQDEARDFLAWGTAHLKDWVPLAPWGRRYPQVTDPGIAFDKFLATWALLRWPRVPGLIASPYFVQHIGDHSALHARGARNDRGFAGPDWSYQPEASCP